MTLSLYRVTCRGKTVDVEHESNHAFGAFEAAASIFADETGSPSFSEAKVEVVDANPKPATCPECGERYRTTAEAEAALINQPEPTTVDNREPLPWDDEDRRLADEPPAIIGEEAQELTVGKESEPDHFPSLLSDLLSDTQLIQMGCKPRPTEECTAASCLPVSRDVDACLRTLNDAVGYLLAEKANRDKAVAELMKENCAWKVENEELRDRILFALSILRSETTAEACNCEQVEELLGHMLHAIGVLEGVG